MTGYSFGDVVLVISLRRSVQNSKKRPAVVIGSDACHLAVTSHVKPTASLGEVTVSDWQGGLLKPSVIKVTIIEKSLCFKHSDG